jgi:hypothetical protein
MNKMLNVVFVVVKGLGAILVKCILQTVVLITAHVNVVDDGKFDFNLVIISRGFFSWIKFWINPLTDQVTDQVRSLYTKVYIGGYIK